MKKYLLGITMAVLAVTNVFAGNNDDDDDYPGGLLHKWFYKLFGIDWRLIDREVKLYGKK